MCPSPAHSAATKPSKTAKAPDPTKACEDSAPLVTDGTPGDVPVGVAPPPPPPLPRVEFAVGDALVVMLPDDMVIVVVGGRVTEALPLRVELAGVGAGPPVAVCVAGADPVAGAASQSALPWAAAMPSSVELQALSRHGVATWAILALPGPHWQARSLAAQPDAARPCARHGIWGRGLVVSGRRTWEAWGC